MLPSKCPVLWHSMVIADGCPEQHYYNVLVDDLKAYEVMFGTDLQRLEIDSDAMRVRFAQQPSAPAQNRASGGRHWKFRRTVPRIFISCRRI
eukprot:2769997-Amphidinium_carterae.1